MRLPKLALLFLALLAPACTTEVDGAEKSESAPAPASPTDELALRAIQLIDSATQVVAETTQHKTVETAAVTLKSLAKELHEVEAELNASKLTMDSHPTYAKHWEEAKQRLRNAVSAMTAEAPKVAKTLTGAIDGLGI